MVRFEGYTSAAATREKIIHDVRARGDAWFRSGDLLKRDRKGYFYFIDRIGDSFRWKGENVSTQEVEEALAACPGIALAVAYGVAVPGTEGRAGMAALTLSGEVALVDEAFYRHVERLPVYARPVFLRIVEQLDMTGTFKVRKIDLQRQGFDPQVINAPLYYRDDAARRYRVLDATAYARIRDRRIKL